MQAARKWRNKTVRLEAELLRRVEVEVRREGTTFTNVVRASLEDYLKGRRKSGVDAFIADAERTVEMLRGRQTAPLVFDRDRAHMRDRELRETDEREDLP